MKGSCRLNTRLEGLHLIADLPEPSELQAVPVHSGDQLRGLEALERAVQVLREDVQKLARRHESDSEAKHIEHAALHLSDLLAREDAVTDLLRDLTHVQRPDVLVLRAQQHCHDPGPVNITALVALRLCKEEIEDRRGQEVGLMAVVKGRQDLNHPVAHLGPHLDLDLVPGQWIGVRGLLLQKHLKVRRPVVGAVRVTLRAQARRYALRPLLDGGLLGRGHGRAEALCADVVLLGNCGHVVPALSLHLGLAAGLLGDLDDVSKHE